MKTFMHDATELDLTSNRSNYVSDAEVENIINERYSPRDYQSEKPVYVPNPYLKAVAVSSYGGSNKSKSAGKNKSDPDATESLTYQVNALGL